MLTQYQGAQIMDNALCGGGDPNQGITYTYPLITSAASNAIKAVIWAGDPRHTTGSPYNYGTSTAGGFDARPAGFSCPTYVSDVHVLWKIQTLTCPSPDLPHPLLLRCRGSVLFQREQCRRSPGLRV